MTEEHQIKSAVKESTQTPLKLVGSVEFCQIVKSMREEANAGGKLKHNWLASINSEKLN